MNLKLVFYLRTFADVFAKGGNGKHPFMLLKKLV